LKKAFSLYGLGYQPSAEELRMLCQPRLKISLERAKNVSRDSLNERFIREGEDFPFCGFPEPWYDHMDKKMKLGMEIFSKTLLMGQKFPASWVTTH